eukprot:5664677-Prymnesium_polylepis.1
MIAQAAADAAAYAAASVNGTAAPSPPVVADYVPSCSVSDKCTLAVALSHLYTMEALRGEPAHLILEGGTHYVD